MLQPSEYRPERPMPASQERAHETPRERRERRAELARRVAAQAERWEHNAALREAGEKIIDQTILTGLQADCALELGRHLMEGVVELDRRRRQLANGDVTLNILLADIEGAAIQQTMEIQRSLYSPFGF